MAKQELNKVELKTQLSRFLIYKNRRWSAKTKRNNDYYFRSLIGFFGNKNFSRDNIEAFFDDMSKKGLAQSSRRQAETSILAFVRWLFDEDILSKNWASRIERTHVEKTPRILPTQSEVISLIKQVTEPGKDDNVLTRFSKAEHRACLLFIVTCSATRNFETREIRLKDISITEKQIVLQEGKTGPRTIAIPPIPWLIEEIAKRVKGRTLEELHVLSDREHYKEDYRDRLFVVNEKRLETLMREVGKRWNGQPLKVHDLRRICLRDLKRNGASIDDVKNVAGHKNLETTMGYLAYDTKDQENTLRNYSSESRKYRTPREKAEDIFTYAKQYGQIIEHRLEGNVLVQRIRID